MIRLTANNAAIEDGLYVCSCQALTHAERTTCLKIYETVCCECNGSGVTGTSLLATIMQHQAQAMPATSYDRINAFFGRSKAL